MNTIEQARCEIGMTRAQMLEALSSRPGRFTLLTYPDDRIDPIFVERARELLSLFRTWRDELVEMISEQEPEDGVYTPTEAAKLLNISEFHLVQLRIRGLISSVKTTQRNHGYTKEALLELVRRNSEVVTEGSTKARGPLASAFMRHLEPRPHSKNFQKIPA